MKKNYCVIFSVSMGANGYGIGWCSVLCDGKYVFQEDLSVEETMEKIKFYRKNTCGDFIYRVDVFDNGGKHYSLLGFIEK